MNALRISVAVFLLLNLLVGLVRVVRGPTLADRMIVAQLFGTTCVAVLLLLSADQARGSLRDVALIFALLSSVTTAAFVRLAPYRRDREGRKP